MVLLVLTIMIQTCLRIYWGWGFGMRVVGRDGGEACRLVSLSKNSLPLAP